MKWRRITEEEVMKVLEQPDTVEESIKGRTNAYRYIGERCLKVTLKEFSEERLIISVVDKGGIKG